MWLVKWYYASHVNMSLDTLNGKDKTTIIPKAMNALIIRYLCNIPISTYTVVKLEDIQGSMLNLSIPNGFEKVATIDDI